MPTKTVQHNGQSVIFDDRFHSYTVVETGQKLISATTWLKQFFPAFDAAKIAPRVAKLRNVPVDQILAEWDRAREEGANRGTILHAYAESVLLGSYQSGLVVLPKEEKKKQASIDQAVGVLLKSFEIVDVEKIIFSPTLGIAGTVDLIMRDPKNGACLIIDWKTNKRVDMNNPWGDKAYPPISKYDACDYIKYSMQLNLYEYIMKKECYEKDGAGFRKAIIWITDEGYSVIRVGDLQSDISAMVIYDSI